MSTHHTCIHNCGGTGCDAPPPLRPALPARPRQEDGEPEGPKVIDPPAEIWLCYGDLDGEDAVHSEWSKNAEVLWCEDQIDSSDVRYVLASTHDEIRALLERWRAAMVFSGLERSAANPENPLHQLILDTKAALAKGET